MNCSKCGAQLPESARFCLTCGTPVTGVGGTVPSPSGPALAPAGVQELKCPGCGAPLTPVFGEMVISCEYCGGSVTLGGNGWKEINKHTMLPFKVTTAADALKIVRAYLDTGFFHRNLFEESTVTEQRLSMVPFWVLPVSSSTNYQYQDVVVGVGSTIGTMVAAEALGSILGGRRGGGGFIPIPIMTGPTVNPTRQDTLTGTYEYPVVAVKSMTAYQPHNYQFALAERSFFDKKGIPNGAVVLNGDLGEEAARLSARAYVMQLQSELAHKKHHMVSHLSTQADVSEGELLHVPVWSFSFERKGQKMLIMVDGHAGRVIQTVT